MEYNKMQLSAGVVVAVFVVTVALLNGSLFALSLFVGLLAGVAFFYGKEIAELIKDYGKKK